MAQSTDAQPRRSTRIKSNPKPEHKPTATRRRSSTATHAVLNTTELLENILIYVPFRTLITSQRVCSLWRDTVNQSTQIKQKLFLLPQPIVDRWAIVGTTSTDLHFTRITPTTILPHPLTISNFWSQESISPQTLYPVRLNPLLVERRFHPAVRNGPSDRVAYQAFFSGCFFVGLAQDLQRNYSAPSWRNMYLCDPPCTKLEACITFESSKAPVHSLTVSFDLEAPDGITFGLLLDRAVEADMTSRDGKKCSKGSYGYSPANQYLEQLEALHQRPAYVQSDNRLETELRLKGVVAPSEEQWEAVSRAATVSDAAGAG
jgi:hypothetical protein